MRSRNDGFSPQKVAKLTHVRVNIELALRKGEPQTLRNVRLLHITVSEKYSIYPVCKWGHFHPLSCWMLGFSLVATVRMNMRSCSAWLCLKKLVSGSGTPVRAGLRKTAVPGSGIGTCVARFCRNSSCDWRSFSRDLSSSN